MKKLSFFLAMAGLLLSGCSHDDFSAQTDELAKQEELAKIRENAEKIFGKIDSRQDWNSATRGKVSITADADLEGIVKVQILTESPFLNPDARVLSEATASAGQTVELSFDAPNVYNRLFAACVNNKGVYYSKGFNVGQQQVSFRAATRGFRAPVASYNFPDLSLFALDIAQSSPSFGAMRSIKANEGETTNSIDLWKGKGWENERLWRLAANTTADNGEWYVSTYKNNTDPIDGIRRNLGGITEAEKTNLNDIFNTFLYPEDAKAKNSRKDNLKIIREAAIFNLMDNNLISTGEPLTVVPVQAFSTEIDRCELYYYYFNPADLVGMDEAQTVQYLKDLPKFKAFKVSQITTGNSPEEFFRNEEYLLPYYGDAPLVDMDLLSDYQTDGKVYRIRNGAQIDGTDYYLTYENNQNNRLIPFYDEDNAELSYQLWQVFKKADGSCYLYNFGIRAFLYYNIGKNGKNDDWLPYFTPDNYLTPDCYPFVIEGNHICRSTNTALRLGSDIGVKDNKGVWTDKTGDAANCEWYFDEYTGSKNMTLLSQLKQAKSNKVQAKSFAIPKGYRVSFMLRKTTSNPDAWKNHYYNWHANGGPYTHNANGECYGDGRLNTELNRFPGHFNSSVKTFSMQEDDPRIAMFTANGKTYMAFEDGSDCNFNDMIFEVSNGVTLTDEPIVVEPAAYTMCFEDRLEHADYDMNDLVLRATRLSETQIQLSVVALGGDDQLQIQVPGSTMLASRELHELFGIKAGEMFINTVKGQEWKEPVSEVFNVEKGTSIVDFLQQITLKNLTTQKTITLPEAGEPPFAIIVPLSFQYPLEHIDITQAYPSFKQWAQDMTQGTDWYKTCEDDKVYPDMFADEE